MNIAGESFFLGIDGGGTKCKAVITNAQGEILGSGLSGPANPLHGYEQAIHSIVHSTEQALDEAGLAPQLISQLVAGVGLAGVNLPSLMDKMLHWRHPFKKMHLTTDLNIACLGAHHGKDGAIIIIGTGSCGYSYVNQQSYCLGGHGFPQGDKGSGAWIGLQAVTVVLRTLDGLEIDSLMTPLILDKLGCNDSLSLVEVVAQQSASFFAQLASIVFDCAAQGDELALRLVKDGAAYINDIAARLWQQKTQRLSLIGGIAPKLTPYLAPEVVERLTPALSAPELGAISFARQQSNDLNSA